MSSRPPPVPPANRSDKGPRSDPPRKGEAPGRGVPGNLAEQDRQGNIKQNTTNQGHQQDR